MEYQKNKFVRQYTKLTNQICDKNCVEINDDACVTCSTNIQIEFKTSMLKPSLYNYSNAYILLSGTKTVAELVAGGGNSNIQVVFKNYAPLHKRNKQYTNR